LWRERRCSRLERVGAGDKGPERSEDSGEAGEGRREYERWGEGGGSGVRERWRRGVGGEEEGRGRGEEGEEEGEGIPVGRGVLRRKRLRDRENGRE
jgi:hypothetical protein